MDMYAIRLGALTARVNSRFDGLSASQLSRGRIEDPATAGLGRGNGVWLYYRYRATSSLGK
jgi:hypothetical protein